MSMPVRWDMSKKICEAYQRKGAGSSDLHGHYHYLVTLITGGSGVQILNGAEITFGAGDVFVLSPMDFHKNCIESPAGYDYLGVKFPYGVIDPRLWELWGNDSFPMHSHLADTANREIRAIMEHLVDECSRESVLSASEIMLKALLEQLIVQLIRAVPSKVGSGADNFISRTLGFLHSNFRDHVSVADAASNVGYTPNYFNTIFRERFGSPFGEYLKKMRLSYAKNLLLSGDSSLTEIAFEAGFCSLSHFSRSFTREYGVFPTEYRRVNKK